MTVGEVTGVFRSPSENELNIARFQRKHGAKHAKNLKGNR
jgi:hypothetical protein